ncbi:MAG: 3-hydroxyacyl-CoA dehydrogenase family protein [Dehalococcoidia bacterium]|nr:3-hydroxyacyl-CoA dehydrogenase family protein [Dehalococcoidia bacterium]
MDVTTVGIVGGGLMGSEIAFTVARSLTCNVVIRDISEEALAKSRETVSKIASRTVRRNEATEEEAAGWIKRISYVTTLEEVAKSKPEIVIEAIFENMELKQEIFAELDRLLPATSLLCTNTSALPITSIAVKTQHPERVVGTHFFNPASIMKLVETVRGYYTSDDTVEKVKDFCRSIGKEAVVCKDGPGFITSRLMAPMLMEAVKCLQEGLASAEDIDKAMKLAYNHPIGPFAFLDLVGLDTMVKVLDEMAKTMGSQWLAPPMMRQLVAAGRLGRKTGKGFYDYSK